MHRYFWGGQAVLLGMWETLAYAKRVPTITATVHGCRRKYRHKADLVVAAWLFGLAAHLFRADRS